MLAANAFSLRVITAAATVNAYGEPDPVQCNDTIGVAHKNEISWTLNGSLGSYTIEIQVDENGGGFSTHKTALSTSPYVENAGDGTYWQIDTEAGTGQTWQYKVRIMDGVTEVHSLTTNTLDVQKNGDCIT